MEERRLLARYERDLQVLPSPSVGVAAAPARFRYDPPRDPGCCIEYPDRTELLVAQNDRVAVSQDSTQRESLSSKNGAVAQFLEFYRPYGGGVLNALAGGLPDANADGLLVVLATPEKPGTGNTLVLSRDLFNVQRCPGSNQMEIAYFDAGMTNELKGPFPDYRVSPPWSTRPNTWPRSTIVYGILSGPGAVPGGGAHPVTSG
jgi:hypothetical protein